MCTDLSQSLNALFLKKFEFWDSSSDRLPAIKKLSSKTIARKKSDTLLMEMSKPFDVFAPLTYLLFEILKNSWTEWLSSVDLANLLLNWLYEYPILNP